MEKEAKDLSEIIAQTLNSVDGLEDRVYPLEGLKNTAPFAFYFQTTEDEEDTLEGPTGLMEAVFEVHIVAKTYASLVWLALSAKTALQALQGTTHKGLLIERVTIRQASPDVKEMEVNLYRRPYRLQVNYQKEEHNHG